MGERNSEKMILVPISALTSGANEGRNILAVHVTQDGGEILPFSVYGVLSTTDPTSIPSALNTPWYDDNLEACN